MTVINTNTAAIKAQFNLNKVQTAMDQSMERLSSGKRINSAADDAAGLSIASRMESQIRGLQMSIRNASDGISLVQSVEGGLQESTNILQRMYELSVQASNSIYNDVDRAALQDEISQLQTELNRIAQDTEFNGQKILDGSFTGKQLNVGFGSEGSIAVNIADHSANGLSNAGTTDAVATLTSTVSAIAMGVANETFDATRTQNAQTFADSQNITRTVLQHNIGSDESQNVSETTLVSKIAASTVSALGFSAPTSTSFDRSNQVAGVSTDPLISVNTTAGTVGADGVKQVFSYQVNGEIEHRDALSMQIVDGDAAVTLTVGSSHLGASDYETKTNALQALVDKWNANAGQDVYDNNGGKVTLSLQIIGGDHYIVGEASVASDTAVDVTATGLTITNNDTSMTTTDFSAGTVTDAASGAGAYGSVTFTDVGSHKAGDQYKVVIDDGGTFTYTLKNSDIGASATETLANIRNSFVAAFNASDQAFSSDSGTLTATLDSSDTSKVTITGSNTTAGNDFVMSTSSVGVKSTNDTSLTVTAVTAATNLAGTTAGPITTGKAADTASVVLEIDVTNFTKDTGDIVQVRFGGHTFEHTVTSSDTATTIGTSLVAEINRAMPTLDGSGRITAANSSGQITLTAANSGAAGAFDVEVETINAAAIAKQGVFDFHSSSTAAGTTNKLNVGETIRLSFGVGNEITTTVTDEIAAMPDTAAGVAEADKAIVAALVAQSDSLNGVSLRVNPDDATQIIWESTIPGVDPGYNSSRSGAVAATAVARKNLVELSGYAGQGDTFTISAPTMGSMSVSVTEAMAQLDTNLERLQAVRDKFVADINASYSSTYTAAAYGDSGFTLEAVTAATDFEITVATTNSTLTAQAKIEQLTLGGPVDVGDSFQVDLGNGNVAEYVATAADVDGKSADAALTAVRDGLMAVIAADGSLTAEAVGGDSIKLTAAVAGTDFRAVSSATNAAAKSQIEQVTIGNVEAGDTFTLGSGADSVSYTAVAGDDATTVAAWMAGNANLSGLSIAADGSSLTVSGQGGVAYSLQAQTSNFGGGKQVDTLSISGSLDRGDVYSLSIDGVSVDTAVMSGDSQSDVINRIVANVNGNADLAGTVVASANGDGTVSLTSAVDGGAFTATASVVDEGRGENTVAAIDITTEAGANAAASVLSGAIEQIVATRAELGAIENRLDHTINNLSNVAVNSESAQSRIQDADFASETSALTKSQILSQAATAMLAQANASKQSVLSLLQG